MICDACFAQDKTCRTCGGTGTLPDASLANGTHNNPRLFATEKFPLHASAIPALMQCSWRMALIYLFDHEGETNEAADTGSATHVAVNYWHRTKELAQAIGVMREVASTRFQQANLDEACALFLLYARDKRNEEAEIAQDKDGKPLLEYKVAITLTPSPDDPTEAPIEIIGTLDQVRIGPDRKKRVWDLKTSKKPGWDQLNMYLYQQAAYAIAASSILGEPVTIGGLITPRHYKANTPPESCPPGIFWHYPHRFQDLDLLLNCVRETVANVRKGVVHISPGDYCRYCPGKGTEECIPLLRSVSDSSTKRIYYKPLDVLGTHQSGTNSVPR